ncbi:MAG TPA: hypothetical protein VKT81_04580 [Bryobacteraceae bacterium]|nr:hypothetical protein [Bryobacteraceae bacterium]
MPTSAVGRFVASALLLILACDTTLPALLTSPESNLPACCRRDGKHHCAMMEMLEKQQESAGPSWKTVAKKCPMFPRGTVASLTHESAPPASVRFADSLSTYSAVKAQTEVLFHISHSRARQKRGPPSFA